MLFMLEKKNSRYRKSGCVPQATMERILMKPNQCWASVLGFCFSQKDSYSWMRHWVTSHNLNSPGFYAGTVPPPKVVSWGPAFQQMPTNILCWSRRPSGSGSTLELATMGSQSQPQWWNATVQRDQWLALSGREFETQAVTRQEAIDTKELKRLTLHSEIFQAISLESRPAKMVHLVVWPGCRTSQSSEEEKGK